MPDGDKFEWMLRGRGWRKIYRLAKSNASMNLIIDEMKKAVAYASRTYLQCPALIDINDLVFEALSDAADPQKLCFGEAERENPYLILTDRLEQVQADNNSNLAVQLAVGAALATYLELQSDCSSIKPRQVQEILTVKFVQQIVRNQILDRVRDGIAASRRHKLDEQKKWEDELLAALADPCRRMFDGYLRTQGQVKVRAPKRITPRMKMDLNTLQQGLKVL